VPNSWGRPREVNTRIACSEQGLKKIYLVYSETKDLNHVETLWLHDYLYTHYSHSVVCSMTAWSCGYGPAA
jgi:hypothetical protein